MQTVTQRPSSERNTMSRFSPFVQAAILALTAYILFTTADVSAKILSGRYPLALCIAAPALIALLGLGAQIIYQRGWAGFKSTQIKLHAARSIIIAVMVTLFVHGLKTVPISDFYCIIFLSPFFVMLTSYFVFKEPLKLERLFVICLAFTGVVVTIGPHFSDMNIGYAYIFGAVLFSSSNIFVIRKMGQDEYSPLYGFYPLLAIVIGNLPFAVQDIPSTLPTGDAAIFLLYGVVLIGAHTFLPMAFAKTPEISLIAPLHYSQMLWGILADIIIFKAAPPMTTYIGAGIIISAGMIMMWKERHHLRKENIKEVIEEENMTLL